MKLATKLLIAIFFSIVFVIIVMSLSFYHFSKSYYKHQLQEDVENRLLSHAEIIGAHSDETTLAHVMMMEAGQEENTFIIFDESLQVINSSRYFSDEVLANYQLWISKKIHQNSKTEFIDTMEEHIPHAWSYTSFATIDGERGYLFIDQDTGSFEKTRKHIFLLTLGIGFLAMCLAVIVSFYLSKRLTNPIMKAQELTREIASGRLDVDVPISTSKDEVSILLSDISIMAISLKEYRDERQQFLTNISHDLRTPLTYIKGYSALLKDQQLEPPVVKEQSNIIYQEASRMEHLVQDLFHLMKYEEGSFHLDVERTDLKGFFDQIQTKLKLDIQSKQLNLKVHAANDDMYVAIDRGQFERAVMNLLSNAIRHTQPGGEINVALTRETQRCMIEIRDNGTGIPEKDLDRIWERFYRVDSSRSTKLGGSGLGLAITKEIIHLHHGLISVSSKMGEGTTFIIEIPAE
ncbi:two-component sensor histidine kinase [Alkalihalophilus pseudofirmus OF4]|uniref:histidine kinase n=1 Tax=Alkalihalophilus pseudofirmus (strain ATCC BAA-2126 / JCM 17055 / OF4) TaxID=398511 RepID=D3FSA2_ALKPO|nr:HAMP domain-containing sensor histidine kinase [Alkalihalophilus pseudofirmus]ADC51737.1 two-component sensor histidine kinase [Alkalihalophilus pseudofirmus OF4]